MPRDMVLPLFVAAVVLVASLVSFTWLTMLVLTFVYLEIRMFFVDILAAESVGDFFTGQVSELLFKYVGQSIENTIHAFIWPVHIIQFQSPWGMGVLMALFYLFPLFIKEPLERWLFDDAD